MIEMQMTKCKLVENKLELSIGNLKYWNANDKLQSSGK